MWQPQLDNAERNLVANTTALRGSPSSQLADDVADNDSVSTVASTKKGQLATRIPKSVLDFVDCCRRSQASLERNLRFILCGRFPMKWKEISSIVVADRCDRAVWWRGCKPCVTTHHRMDRKVCSVVFVELSKGEVSPNGLVAPVFVVRIIPVPISVEVPSSEEAFWEYHRPAACSSVIAAPSQQIAAASTCSSVIAAPSEATQQIVAASETLEHSVTDSFKTFNPVFDHVMSHAQMLPFKRFFLASASPG